MKISPRHLVWANLVLLALVAYGGASTVSTAIEAKLAPPPEVHLLPPPPPIAKEPHRPVSYYAAISTRDIFNSVHPTEAVVAAVETPQPTKCNGKLWGVVVHNDDASSYAIIEDASTHKQDVYRVGASTGNCGTVKQVEWDRVILNRDGRDEILELANAQPHPAAAPAQAVAAAVQVPPPPLATDPHIQKVSDNEYNMDKSEVDSALENMNQLFTQIRAVPHFDGGQSTGFRLFAIRQNSIFDKIGLRNGDIIQSVNGSDINDPAKALAPFGELRNQRQVCVKILRNKDPQTVCYNIN
jgi:general secretion pathway protein C